VYYTQAGVSLLVGYLGRVWESQAISKAKIEEQRGKMLKYLFSNRESILD